MRGQIKSLIDNDFTGQNEMIKEVIANNPQLSIAQISEKTGLQKSSVSRAVNSLIVSGCLIVTERSTGRLYTYDQDPRNWSSRASEISRARQLAKIAKFVEEFGCRLTPTDKNALRELYRRVRTNPIK